MYYERSKVITIIGATGYIGMNLVKKLSQLNEYHIKILTRSVPDFTKFNNNVEVVVGDLTRYETLRDFFVEKCIVINLVYFWNASNNENIDYTANLLSACKETGVTRLIHCSTAAVVGRVSENNITEVTECKPVSEYGQTKLNIERMITKENSKILDVAILRPTAVFGRNGEPLKKLCHELVNHSWLRNYLKSSLFGFRRMNLVHVDNVVSSIIFFIKYKSKIDANVFIIADDENRNNNFRYIESTMMSNLHISKYPILPLPIPLFVLKFILKILKRNNINPSCNYSSEKIKSYGFKFPVIFEDGLFDYVNWYRSLDGK